MQNISSQFWIVFEIQLFKDERKILKFALAAAYFDFLLTLQCCSSFSSHSISMKLSYLLDMDICYKTAASFFIYAYCISHSSCPNLRKNCEIAAFQQFLSPKLFDIFIPNLVGVMSVIRTIMKKSLKCVSLFNI